MNRFLVLTLACLALPCVAQEARPAPGEPAVKRTIIEDDGARIEELRVRGQVQRITVTPKRGSTRSYEIITSDGSRDLSAGVNASRGAAGKSAWNVLTF